MKSNKHGWSLSSPKIPRVSEAYTFLNKLFTSLLLSINTMTKAIYLRKSLFEPMISEK